MGPVVMLTRFFAPRTGGVERHVLRVSQELSRRGIPVEVVTWRYDPALAREEKVEGIPTHRIAGTEGHAVPGARLLEGWRAVRPLQGLFGQAAALHLHDYSPFLDWALPRALRHPRAKIFVTFHGYEADPPPRGSRWVRKVLAWRAAGRIGVGAWIPRWYGTPCDAITYGGVDLRGPAPPAAREERALFVGRLAPDTGLLGYIRALALARASEGIDLPLDICGAGPLEAEARRLAERQGIRAHFHGIVPDPYPLMARARVGFLDSYLALLEAMAAGLPVVSLAASPLKRDYLGSFPGAQFIDIASDPQGLARALPPILRGSPEVQARVEGALRFAARTSWATVADLYCAVYREAGVL